MIGSGSGLSISNSYATGDVSGISTVGGLIGFGSGSSILNSYATGDISGNTSNDRLAGLIGSSNSSVQITDSFSTGSIVNTGTGSAHGITNSSLAILTNVYWNNSAPGTDALTCFNGGDTNCTIETDITQFYQPTYPVYTRPGFEWDFTSIWQDQPAALPILR